MANENMTYQEKVEAMLKACEDLYSDSSYMRDNCSMELKKGWNQLRTDLRPVEATLREMRDAVPEWLGKSETRFEKQND